MDEKHMDAVTGLSASGPAFIYIILESLAEGGVKVGLSRELATLLAAQMTLGAAKMVIETGHHPALLKDTVTTPAGCTIDGILELEEGGLRVTLIKAVVKAAQRAKELLVTDETRHVDIHSSSPLSLKSAQSKNKISPEGLCAEYTFTRRIESAHGSRVRAVQTLARRRGISQISMASGNGVRRIHAENQGRGTAETLETHYHSRKNHLFTKRKCNDPKFKKGRLALHQQDVDGFYDDFDFVALLDSEFFQGFERHHGGHRG